MVRSLAGVLFASAARTFSRWAHPPARPMQVASQITERWVKAASALTRLSKTALTIRPTLAIAGHQHVICRARRTDEWDNRQIAVLRLWYVASSSRGDIP
jgi:hypothetical protein